MGYKLMYDLDMFKSPIIIVYNGSEKKYENGAAAQSTAVFAKPVIVSSIKARENEILVYVEENTKFNDSSWTDHEVSFF